MRTARDELFDWVLNVGPRAGHNLTSSGLPEPPLKSMGIDTSFESFASESDEHERVFCEDVARLYHVEPGSVVATAGGSEAIFLAFSVFGEGGRAAVSLPNYPPMFAVPRSLGMQVDASPAQRNLPGSIRGTTDPNNPTGENLDPETVDAFVRSARRNGGTLYINETYMEFNFGAPRTHFGVSDEVVTSSTMTKFYGLGRLRVGWMLADERRARQLLYAKWEVSGHDSMYSLWIASQVLRKRKEFVERARSVLGKNIGLVRKFLEETKGVTAELGVAPFCLVRYGKGPGSVPLARRILSKTGVLVAPGDFFGAPRSFRLCYTTDEATLRSGLDALSGFFNRA